MCCCLCCSCGNGAAIFIAVLLSLAQGVFGLGFALYVYLQYNCAWGPPENVEMSAAHIMNLVYFLGPGTECYDSRKLTPPSFEEVELPDTIFTADRTYALARLYIALNAIWIATTLWMLISVTFCSRTLWAVRLSYLWTVITAIILTTDLYATYVYTEDALSFYTVEGLAERTGGLVIPKSWFSKVFTLYVLEYGAILMVCIYIKGAIMWILDVCFLCMATKSLCSINSKTLDYQQQEERIVRNLRPPPVQTEDANKMTNNQVVVHNPTAPSPVQVLAPMPTPSAPTAIANPTTYPPLYPVVPEEYTHTGQQAPVYTSPPYTSPPPSYAKAEDKQKELLKQLATQSQVVAQQKKAERQSRVGSHKNTNREPRTRWSEYAPSAPASISDPPSYSSGGSPRMQPYPKRDYDMAEDIATIEPTSETEYRKQASSALARSFSARLARGEWAMSRRPGDPVALSPSRNLPRHPSVLPEYQRNLFRNGSASSSLPSTPAPHADNRMVRNVFLPSSPTGQDLTRRYNRSSYAASSNNDALYY